MITDKNLILRVKLFHACFRCFPVLRVSTGIVAIKIKPGAVTF